MRIKHLLPIILFMLPFLSNGQSADTSAKSKQAEYPGGMKECYTFIKKNLHYPDTTRGIEGKVYLQFTIDTLGVISDVRVKRSMGKKFDDEAIRVVQLMPNWIPGVMNGKPVKSRFTMPIMFKNTL